MVPVVRIALRLWSPIYSTHTLNTQSNTYTYSMYINRYTWTMYSYNIWHSRGPYTRYEFMYESSHNQRSIAVAMCLCICMHNVHVHCTCKCKLVHVARMCMPLCTCICRWCVSIGTRGHGGMSKPQHRITSTRVCV